MIDNKGNTLIINACREGDYKTVKLLLNLGLDINQQNYDGNTALHYAKDMKNWKMVDLLIENNANENIANNNNLTPWEIE